MRIDAGSYLYQSGQTGLPIVGTPLSLADASASKPADATAADTTSSGISKTDFTSMTRKQMSDWMNNQIRSGAMCSTTARRFSA